MGSHTGTEIKLNRRWLFRSFDESLVRWIEQECRVSAVVAHLLACRGLHEPQVARDFLDNKLTNLRDPGELPGCAAAADLVWQSIERGEKIAIYGDYDADGMTATAILVSCLQQLNADVTSFVPNRLDDGYGLNDDALRRLAQRGVKTVVSVDCGIASLGCAQTARDLGLQLIVTDHHTMADTLPCAAAIVHPRLPGHDYPFGDLCGAGVAFKLAWRLCQLASGSTETTRVAPHLREFLFQGLALAAIGTVADVVPLIDENRALVAHGLVCLKERPPLGLAHLMRITKLDQKPTLSSEDIGFTIGPRLNAAGRLGQAQLGVELLLTQSEERAETLAAYIHELNKNRETLERSIYRSADQQIKEHFDSEQDTAFVLADRTWHAGVIGIVAGRLAEKYHRPTLLVALDQAGNRPGTGSARSAGGVNLHAALERCQEFLASYGGHAAAAGFRIEEERIDEFRQAFCDAVSESVEGELGEPELEIDVETRLSHLDLGTLQQMDALAPFGQGNPRPLLCSKEVFLADQPKRMGGGERHLALQLKQDHQKLRAVAFGKGEWAELLTDLSRPIDVVYRPVINEFNGFRRVELHLVDWRESQSSPPT